MRCKLSILLLLLAGLIISCNDGNEQKTPQPIAQTPTNDLKPFSEIEFGNADTIVRNYQDKFKTKLEASANEHIGNEQTKHIWVDINDLEKFIGQLKNKQSPDTPLSGIRLYFAAYLKDGHIHREARLKKRLTLVGCGTWDSSGYHVDLIPRSPNKNTKITALIMGDYQNHGHLCPPEAVQYCSGAVLGHN